ncbi:MAG: HAMP domain-containing protein, partial [Sphingomonadales bacterium]
MTGRGMRSGTRARVFAFTALLGLIALLLAGAGYWAARHALSAQLNERVQDRVSMLLEVERRQGPEALVKMIEQLGQRGMRSFGYCLSRGGKHLYGATDTPMLAPGWHDINVYDLDDSRYETARALTVTLGNGDHLTVVADRDFLTAFDTTLAGIFIGLLLVVVLLAGAGALLLERFVSRRLASINDLAGAVRKEGDLNRRIPLSARGDEFDRLAAVLNGMLDQIGDLIAEVRRVNGYLAHDLRRPLASLHDRLRSLRPMRGERARQLGQAEQEVQSLLQLFDAILELGEHRGLGVPGEPFDLDELAQFMGESFQPIAEAEGKQLSVQASAGTMVIGVRHLL